MTQRITKLTTLKKNIYDLILVIKYNMNPVKKNKGSAIFLHLTSK